MGLLNQWDSPQRFKQQYINFYASFIYVYLKLHADLEAQFLVVVSVTKDQVACLLKCLPDQFGHSSNALKVEH